MTGDLTCDSAGRAGNPSARFDVRGPWSPGCYDARRKEVPTTGKETGTMKGTIKVKTGTKAGGWTHQHNRGIKVRSAIRAGGFNLQHNRGIKVRSAIKAGGLNLQHSRKLTAR
jgi:hypothetical protein